MNFKLFFKRIFLFSFALFATFLAVFLLSLIYILSFYNSNSDTKADCVLVFGAALNADGSPSDILYDRVASAVRLYKENKASCLLMSGADTIYGKHEADAMKDLSVELGVPAQDVLEDKKGVNTCASIKNLKKDRTYILLSNDFHLARINSLAKRFKINYSLQSSDSLHGNYLKTPYFLTREVFALWYYNLFFDGSCKKAAPWLDNYSDMWINGVLNKYIRVQ